VIRHHTNLGLVASLNEGLIAARAVFVARIDADDRYRPNFLRETLAAFRAHPEAGLVYADVALMDENGTILEEPWTGINSREAHRGQDRCGNEYLHLIEDNCIPTPTVIARREVWREALPIPEELVASYSDWYLNLRIARKHSLCYRSCVLADYRIHRKSMHCNLPLDESVENSVLQVLERFFTEESYKQQTRRIRRRVYTRAYLNLADRYFSLKMSADARRCYLKAIRQDPRCLLRFDILRHLGGAVLGHRAYARVKSSFYPRVST
jgi:glycosyltransferase involved in cell wall biosynthesis